MTVTPEDIAQRLDLRDEPIFTIDSADAKDLDDAICVHRRRTATSLVCTLPMCPTTSKPKAPLTTRPTAGAPRCTSRTASSPCCPRPCPNGVCSLNAGTEKLTFSALMEFDTQGNMTHYEFRKAVINSKVRGVYSEVNEILAGTASQQLLDKSASSWTA